MKDRQLIDLFNDYRVLTTAQLAHVLNKSEQMTRKYIRQLRSDGLIRELPRKPTGRGRPRSAFALLKDEFKPHLLEHHLALNWCRIKTTSFSDAKAEFISHMGTNLRLKVPTSPSKTCFQTFIPDGALCIANSSNAFLIFVEVDMGTEPLRASKNGSTDFLEKLDAYRVFFGTKGYKQFESRFDASFNGFRLLVVASSEQRSHSITRFLQTEPFCQFVAVVELAKLKSHNSSDEFRTTLSIA